ncbi:MAG: response regulator [Planctomycetota bacterium]|jgi:signal transduction histidine kinase|nr:response regulator [Planctomycetota bacterium]MDP6762628.1 response regulator [Planctomycetota bacterium]MDP6989113.1 response regulator [Planctomycetota bacterium]
MSAAVTNPRILLVDDSPAIHSDFHKILAPAEAAGSSLEDARAAFMGEAAATQASRPVRFELQSALGGREALELARTAAEEDRPFAMAFVDVRMPPGWDGIETIERLWEVDERLQVVICTAYSDHTWTETFERLGRPDNLLILKKPFDPVEILQLASALTEKWSVTRSMEGLLEAVQAKEREARSYASSLETVNRALAAAKAAAERSSAMKTELLVRLSDEVAGKVGAVIGHVEHLRDLPTEDEELIGRLEPIFRSGRTLSDTLEDVVDLTRIEAGDLETQRRECSPEGLARGAVERFAAEADRRGVSLEVEVSEGVPTRFVTDPGRTRQILETLVGFAVANSRGGTVGVTLRAEATDDHRNPILSLTVAAQACSIEPDRFATLFEALPPADSIPGGAGVGLAFARRLARVLGGDLTAAEGDSGGARFTLRLSAGERARL